MRLTRKVPDAEARPSRRIVSGPVDFAARRERIQRAYTKSIHESEQREIRAANLRRLNERRQNEAAAAAQMEMESAATREADPEISRASPAAMTPDLHVSTSFHPVGVPDSLVGKENATSTDSPTLGIPGTYVADDDEAPPSAISNAATEFDNEPQTEAPRPSHVTPETHPHLSMQSDQHLEPEDWSRDTSSSRQGYNSEFTGSIQILLDTTETATPQQEITPTGDVFSTASTALGDVDQPYESSSHHGAIPVISEPHNQEAVSSELSNVDTQREYFGGGTMPNITPSGNELIQPTNLPEPDVPGMFPVSPEVDEYTPGKSETAPRLELPMLRTALATPSIDSIRGHEYAESAHTEMESDGLEAVEDTSAMDPDVNRPVYRHSGSFLPPSVYRPRHQSGWTDESIETAEDSIDYGDYQEDLQGTEPLEPTRRPTPPPKEIPTPELVQSESYSPQQSPKMSAATPMFSMPDFQQLPPLDTGEGLGLGFPSPSPGHNISTIPMWPDHSPPPIPQEAFVDTNQVYHTQRSPPPSAYNRQSTSSVYRASHDPESRRASDDLYSPRGSISTPRSSTQISFEDVSATQFMDGIPPKLEAETEEERQAAEKEAKRLFKRRMLIKELLDTESVYLKDMNVVEEIYKGTAEACPKLDTEDIRAIFRNSDEIVAFSTKFLDELKSASSSVYTSRSHKSRQSKMTTNTSSTTEDRLSVAGTLAEESDDQKDRKTFIGATFGKHLVKMQEVYTNFLKNSEVASTRLTALQEDAAVKVWLDECNHVAKDLTAAWSLDALLVKPVQRITRYQLLLHQIFECTPTDHPDYKALKSSCDELGKLLKNIDDLKKRIQMVGKIVNRKRKESDVRSGLAKAFGRRAEKFQLSSTNRPPEDEVYQKLHEKFGDDYLRLQVVLRDVEYYTRQVTTYVNDFLRYLSAMELIMRMQASSHPEIESKWSRFNMSMRDMGTVALEDHVSSILEVDAYSFANYL